MMPNNAALYITILNIISTLTAIYGLIILKSLVLPYLSIHKVNFKLVVVQVTMLSTVVIDLIIGIISSQGLLPCTGFMGSKDRASRKYCKSADFMRSGH